MYLYNGRQVLRGALPHRDLFDQRPPFQDFFYAISMALWGQSMRAVRLGDLLWCVLTAGAVLLAGRRAFGKGTGAWAALLYGIGYQCFFNFWDSAQSEGFIVLPLALAVYFALTKLSDDRAWEWTTAGGFCGLAFWFKPTAVLVFLALAGWAVMGEQQRTALRRLIFLTAGLLVPLLAVLGAYALAGGLPDLIRQVFWYNAAVHWPVANDRSAWAEGANWTFRFVLKTHLLWALGALAVVFGKEKGGPAMHLMLAWAGASLLAVWAQGRFFGYHWIPMTAPLAVLAGQGIVRGWAWWRGTAGRRRLLSGLLAGGLLCVSLGVYAWRYGPEYAAWRSYQRGNMTEEAFLGRFVRKDFDYLAQRAVARQVQQMTTPADGVLVWGFDPLIAFLAGRDMPTRFPFNYPLVAPAESAWLEKWREEFLVDFQREMPAVIVMGERDYHPLHASARSSAEEMEAWPAFAALLRKHYVLVGRLEGFRLYQRVDILGGASE